MNSKRIEEIEKSMAELREKLSEHDRNFDFNKPFHVYEKSRAKYADPLCRLDQELRMIKDYELSDIPEYGDLMSLQSFIDTVNDGFFIDYDGSGNYCIDGKMTDISVYPSDVKAGKIRREFDKVVWFNR